MEMNPQRHHVVSDIAGVTATRIIRAIVGGERDLDVLASYRDVRCRASVETIKAALNRNNLPEPIFTLTQSLELYHFYKAKMLEFERHFVIALSTRVLARTMLPVNCPMRAQKTRQGGTPSFDVRAALFGVLGADLTEIYWMGPSLLFKLVGECGTDLRASPSVKQITSWLCLAPG